uniref:Uncharacterized protein n=1 Tax=Parascaris equorum TaxID=6256 RepID=A0A914R4C3_PAREQ
MLQPFDSTNSSETEPAKHKFMVQSAFTPPGDVPLGSVLFTFAFCFQPCSLHGNTEIAVFVPATVGRIEISKGIKEFEITVDWKRKTDMLRLSPRYQGIKIDAVDI